MAKKAKALGKDPLFWVRDTQKEKPDTSEQPPPDDAPTAHVEPDPTRELLAAQDAAAEADAGPASVAPSAPGRPAGPRQSPPPQPVPGTPYALGAFPLQEIREPRWTFLVLVLLNMLLLLALGLIGYFSLSGRVERLEQRVGHATPSEEAPSSGTAVK